MPYLDTGRISLFFEEAGTGSVPVVLLHELGGSSESWRELIPLLATDRRVIGVDMIMDSISASVSGSSPPIRIVNNARAITSEMTPPLRDRKFADSLVEGNGFELLVRGRGEAGCRAP